MYQLYPNVLNCTHTVQMYPNSVQMPVQMPVQMYPLCPNVPNLSKCLSKCTHTVQMYPICSNVPDLFKCTQLCPNACPNVPNSVQLCPNVPTLYKCTQLCPGAQTFFIPKKTVHIHTYIQPNYICKLHPTFLSSALSLSTQLALVPYVSPLCSLTTSALFSAMQAVYNGY